MFAGKFSVVPFHLSQLGSMQWVVRMAFRLNQKDLLQLMLSFIICDLSRSGLMTFQCQAMLRLIICDSSRSDNLSFPDLDRLCISFQIWTDDGQLKLQIPPPLASLAAFQVAGQVILTETQQYEIYHLLAFKLVKRMQLNDVIFVIRWLSQTMVAAQ